MAWAAMWLQASLLCLTPLLAPIYCKNIVGIVGENITFPVQTDQKIEEIVWKKDKNKVAEWEVQNTPTYFGRLRNRSVLMENGSLTIVNLEKEDAGTYELQYRDSVKDNYLSFTLAVFGPLSEPKISCNVSDGKLVLNCTGDFQESLNYAWKLSNDPRSHSTQVLSIPLKNVDTITATCTIQFSQTKRSSEIPLSQCLPEEKGQSSSERNRGALIAIVAVTLGGIVLVVFLYKKGIIKCGAGRTAQNNGPVNGSGEQEQLFLGNSQQQPNSEGAACSHTVHCEDEEPEAERALNEDNSALKDKQIVENGVNLEEVTQNAEGENGEHLNNSSSCNKEDLKA